MAKYVIEDTTLTNIASAIREKTGKSNLMLPSQMPNEIQNISSGGGSDTGYEPNADMKWAKQVCIDDVEENFTYKMLEMINDNYTYHDIIVPSGGAVKTSDGGYYTSNEKHIWNDENSKVPEYYKNVKLRWIITYYPSETTNAFKLYDDTIYAVIDGLKHSNTDFSVHYLLENFEYINDGKYTGKDFSRMFNNCCSLQNIPNLDTSQGTNFSNMFSNCSSLQSIPSLDTSQGTSFGSMFSNCSSLQSIPSLDTSQGTTFTSMFINCSSLQNVPQLDTSQGTSFGNMFAYCYSLKNIPKLNVSLGTNFSSMFDYCSSLQNLPELDTNKGTIFTSMFVACASLQKIEKVDFMSAKSIGTIFNNSSKLEFINFLNISKSLNLSSSTKYSRETLVNGVLNNLVDLTGVSTQILTLGSTNLKKLTEEDKLIATNKNWTLA